MNISFEPVSPATPAYVRLVVSDGERSLAVGEDGRSRFYDKLHEALDLRLDEPRSDWPPLDGHPLSHIATFDDRSYVMGHIDGEQLVLVFYPPYLDYTAGEAFRLDADARLRLTEALRVPSDSLAN